MNRRELLDQLAIAEWNVSQGARRLAEHRNILRHLRARMRDVTNAEELLTDLAAEHLYSIRERDQLRAHLQERTEIRMGITDSEASFAT